MVKIIVAYQIESIFAADLLFEI